MPSPQCPQPTHVCSTELEFEVLILPANIERAVQQLRLRLQPGQLVCGRKVFQRCSTASVMYAEGWRSLGSQKRGLLFET
jgi:hypothetical protein